jgi:hypothetical protein
MASTLLTESASPLVRASAALATARPGLISRAVDADCSNHATYANLHNTAIDLRIRHLDLLSSGAAYLEAKPRQ